MSSLFNLTSDYLKVKRMEEEGADPELIRDTLESIDSDIEVKADNYVGLIKQLEAEIEAVKKEEMRLSELKRSKSNLINHLKTNLQEMMEATGKERFKTDLHSFYIQNNPMSLEITDESNIPMQFVEEVTERKINKKELLKYLKSEDVEAIEGVVIKQTKGVRFR